MWTISCKILWRTDLQNFLKEFAHVNYLSCPKTSTKQFFFFQFLLQKSITFKRVTSKNKHYCEFWKILVTAVVKSCMEWRTLSPQSTENPITTPVRSQWNKYNSSTITQVAITLASMMESRRLRMFILCIKLFMIGKRS